MNKQLSSMVMIAAITAALSTMAATSIDYRQRGLVAHWDAIDNAGAGIHDANATSWQDLSGNGFDWTLNSGTYSWKDTAIELKAGFQQVVGSLASKTAADFKGKLKTIEVVYRLTDNYDSTIIFDPGLSSGNRRVGVSTMKLDDGATALITFYSNDTAYDYMSLDINSICAYRVVYSLSGDAPSGIQYETKNGVKGENVAYSDGLNFTSTPALGGRVATWTKPARGDLMAIRIYDRTLSSEEAALNYAIDRIRFFGDSPSSVTLPAGWKFNEAGHLECDSSAKNAGEGVFDDARVWYRGAAGNAVGTEDSGGASGWSGNICKMKNLGTLSSGGSETDGAKYFWWGYRVKYDNTDVKMPYANIALGDSPCMIYPGTVTTNGYAEVKIGGETMSRPIINYRVGAMRMADWLPNWESGSVCSNYSCVLRFRPGEAINPVSGGNNAMGLISLNYAYQSGDNPSGVSIVLNTLETLSNRFVPRIWVGANQFNLVDHQIRQDRWADLAIVAAGPKLTIHLCYEDGEDGATTNVLYTWSHTFKASESKPSLAASRRDFLLGSKGVAGYSYTFTNGVSSSTLVADYRGAFHQVAFWDRTLSDAEVREAMGRPALVRVGLTGNIGNGEFVAKTTQVRADGDWEDLNPLLTENNPTATILFDCPPAWAGLPQFLRVAVCSDSDSGALLATVGGVEVGTLACTAGTTANVYVPANVIADGANTLVLTRQDGGAVKIDAITLDGSWQYGWDEKGQGVGLFGYDSSNADATYLHPACGTEKFHLRGVSSYAGQGYTYAFRVAKELAGDCRGTLRFRVQNTGGDEYPVKVSVNGTLLGTIKVSGGNSYEMKVPNETLVGGWNTAAFEPQGGWMNMDCHKFVIKPWKRVGMCIIIK